MPENQACTDSLSAVRIWKYVVTAVFIVLAIKAVSEKSRHFSEVSNYTNKFDSADYANKSFNMFSGEPKPIQLICNNDLLDVMLDRFGKSVKIQKNDENSFILRTNAAVSEGLIAWILQFGPRVKVKSPNDLIYEIKKKAQEISELYKLKNQEQG